MNLKIFKDYEFDEQTLSKVLSKVQIDHQVEDGKAKKLINGVNIYAFERDENNVYKVIKYMSTKKNAKTLTMIKEGNLYKPLYISMDGKKQAIFESNSNFLDKIKDKL
jgi:hypothetical protein